MKRLIGFAFLGLSLGLFAQNNDPVIMTINNDEVKKSEFEQIFWKNKKEKETNKEELDEYLDLFIKFKLKVEAAEAAGLDTTQKFTSEFNGYKMQLQKPYLADTTVTEELIQEAYYRTTNELRASHILIKVDADAAPKDTLEAYKKIMKVRDDIIAGKLSFEDAAAKFSEDPSAKTNKGDLGYFSAFRMVYPFENAAYNTPIGQVSMPFRTRFGYHIVNPVDMRKSRGRVKVAHIMVLVKKNATDQEKDNAKLKIEEIYGKLKNGDDFSALVRDYSDDRNSVRKNGELEWVEAGRYFKEFEDAAFSISKDGDFSNPVLTPAGWHIIKRIEYQPIDDLEGLRLEIKNKIQRDPVRAAKTKSSFINKLKKEYAFMETPKTLDNMIKVVTATTATKKGKNVIVTDQPEQKNSLDKLSADDKKKVLFSYAGKSILVSDFVQYLQPRWNESQILVKEDFIRDQYTRFIDNELTEYEKTRLEAKYPEYKALLKEYRDGILLFEINDQKVWSNAIKDTAGLRKFYEANKQNYMWTDRTDARIFVSKDKKIIKQAYKLVKKGALRNDSIVNYLNKDSQLNISFESGRYEKGQNSYLDNPSLTLGVNKPFLQDDKYVLVAIDKQLPAQPKKLNEAKGAITAAYQEYLEANWVKELEQKYSVTVNKDVLYTIKKKP